MAAYRPNIPPESRRPADAGNGSPEQRSSRGAERALMDELAGGGASGSLENFEHLEALLEGPADTVRAAILEVLFLQSQEKVITALERWGDQPRANRKGEPVRAAADIAPYHALYDQEHDLILLDAAQVQRFQAIMALHAQVSSELHALQEQYRQGTIQWQQVSQFYRDWFEAEYTRLERARNDSQIDRGFLLDEQIDTCQRIFRACNRIQEDLGQHRSVSEEAAGQFLAALEVCELRLRNMAEARSLLLKHLLTGALRQAYAHQQYDNQARPAGFGFLRVQYPEGGGAPILLNQGLNAAQAEADALSIDSQEIEAHGDQARYIFGVHTADLFTEAMTAREHLITALNRHLESEGGDGNRTPEDAEQGGESLLRAAYDQGGTSFDHLVQAIDSLPNPVDMYLRSLAAGSRKKDQVAAALTACRSDSTFTTVSRIFDRLATVGLSDQNALDPETASQINAFLKSWAEMSS